MRVAILDMNNGVKNQGLRCIKEIVTLSGFDFKVFDVRVKNELPDMDDFNIYISTGGPGEPLEPDAAWQQNYFKFIKDMEAYNKHEDTKPKKYVFFICHSFQLACHIFDLAEVMPRKSNSFGVFPIHKTPNGKKENIFKGLEDRYWGVDSRDYQVVQPNLRHFKKKGAQVLSLEKLRNHVELERAIMAVRFSPYMIGTQFHPEADPISFMENLRDADKRATVKSLIGEAKFRRMLEYLLDDEKVTKTYNTILPQFLKTSQEEIERSMKSAIKVA